MKGTAPLSLFLGLLIIDSVASAPVVKPAQGVFRRAGSPGSQIVEDAVSWLCGHVLPTAICQKAKKASVALSAAAPFTITLTNGVVVGAQTSSGTRYTVPYAKPPTGALRFQDPQALSKWSGVYNATGLPPACPQDMDSSMASSNEDCLYLQVFTPKSATANSKLPVFVWVHGGSFLTGGSTASGLDGSVLSGSKNMVVITIQYRLGVLGLLRSSSAGISGNFAIKDAIMALTYIKNNVVSFGGDAARVTLAGQSSGGDLVKTLLTVPSADNLFARAIIQSAPLNYADHTAAIADSVGSSVLAATGCSSLSCLQGLSVSSILAAQSSVYTSAPADIAGVAASEPFKPWVDGSLVKQDFLNAANGANGGLTNKNRQIMFTTVQDEAAPTIYQVSNTELPTDYFTPIFQALLTPASRFDIVNSSAIYADELDGFVKLAKPDATRDELTFLGTDYVWRCAVQQSAVNLTANAGQSGKVWLAEFDNGIPYPSSQAVPYCSGKICHEDDIYAVFGTGTGLSSSQQVLTAEVAARWAAFAATGNPNAAGYVQWPAVSSATNLQMLVFNDGVASTVRATQRPQACSIPSGIWGIRALFDSQMYA